MGNLAEYVFIIRKIPDKFNKKCVFSCYSRTTGRYEFSTKIP